MYDNCSTFLNTKYGKYYCDVHNMYLLLLFFAVESDSPRIWAVWQEKKKEVEEEEVEVAD